MKKRIAALISVLVLLCAVALTTGQTEDHIHHYEAHVYAGDSVNHWHVCNICGAHLYVTPHTLHCANASGGCCEVCGLTLSDLGAVIQHTGFVMEHDASSHWERCTGCGEIRNAGSHVSACNNPGVCAACGATAASGAQVKNGSHAWKIYHNAQTHWAMCTVCGEIMDRENHYAVSCGAPDQCSFCGAAKAEGAVISAPQHNYLLQYDANNHWWQCSGCGASYGREGHYATCVQPNLCAVCGARKSEGAVYDTPSHDWVPVHDDLSHWEVCAVCGLETESERHYATCGNPDRCALCGAKRSEGAVYEVPAHNWVLMHDGVRHWNECTGCGAVKNQENHFAVCTGPADVCAVCGVSAKNGAAVALPVHTPGAALYTSTVSHWHKCVLCGGRADEEPHKFVNGVCAVCGKAMSGATPAPTPVPEPTQEPLPRYIFLDTALEGGRFSGRAVHVDGTPLAELLVIRVHLTLADGGEFVIAWPVLTPDGAFEIVFSDIAAADGIVITDTLDCIAPDAEWDALGVYTF